MGCDIHIVAERLTAPDTWIGIRDFHSFHDKVGGWCFPAALERNYERFAALAGIRGDGPIVLRDRAILWSRYAATHQNQERRI